MASTDNEAGAGIIIANDFSDLTLGGQGAVTGREAGREFRTRSTTALDGDFNTSLGEGTVTYPYWLKLGLKALQRLQ